MRFNLGSVVPSSLLSLAFLAGCAPTYEAPEPPPPQPTAAPAPAPAPATPPPAPAAPATPRPMQMAGHTIDLMPVNESGVSGTAMMRGAAAGRTEVTVNLRGASGAGTHEGHVHSGTCANIGAPVFPLEPVMANDEGMGRSVSEIAAQPMSLMDGSHLIAFHEAGGDPGAPITCGQIPAMSHR